MRVRCGRRQQDCKFYISVPITEHEFNVVVNGASALAVGASFDADTNADGYKDVGGSDGGGDREDSNRVVAWHTC